MRRAPSVRAERRVLDERGIAHSDGRAVCAARSAREIARRGHDDLAHPVLGAAVHVGELGERERPADAAAKLVRHGLDERDEVPMPHAVNTR